MNHIIEFRNPIQKAARESVQSKKCAFTGHRPQSLPFGFDESDERCIALKSAMQERIVALIENEGVTHFITGMALGVDTFAAEIVLQLKSKRPMYQPRKSLKAVLRIKRSIIQILLKNVLAV